MVHLRLNEKEANPNEHVNFITPLVSTTPGAPAPESARQLLRALAAQVRPPMRAHGLAVNSLEEYEHNSVFAGRNWNNGETVELVLRGPGGGFLPTSWLISTLCHELAHIKHMNHGPAFQALWARLRKEVRELHIKGYYGDGFWSSGTRLADHARAGGPGLDPAELPEYMCGGAQSRTRPTASRRRRGPTGPRKPPTASAHTGAQTTRKRKAGGRVTSKYAFAGEGAALDAGVAEAKGKKAGAGFGKRAGSKRAREERALAIERRLRALGGPTTGPSSSTKGGPSSSDSGSGAESDTDTEEIPETDTDRRRTLLDATDATDLDALRSARATCEDDFVLPPRRGGSGGEGGAWTGMVPGEGAACGPSEGGKGTADAAKGVTGKGKGKARAMDDDVIDLSSSDDGVRPSITRAAGSSRTHIRTPSVPSVRKYAPTSAAPAPAPAPATGKNIPNLALGRLVADEVSFRKKESLGLAGSRSAQTLGGTTTTTLMDTTKAGTLASLRVRDAAPPRGARAGRAGADGAGAGAAAAAASAKEEWACLVCTLHNVPDHLACTACATPRGDAAWAGVHQ